MSQHIKIAGGRKVSLGSYVMAWRKAKALKKEGKGNMEIAATPCCEYGGTVDGMLRQISQGVHARINRHIAGYGIGRKWKDDWQWGIERFRRAVESRQALRLRDCPVDIQHRFNFDGDGDYIRQY